MASCHGSRGDGGGQPWVEGYPIGAAPPPAVNRGWLLARPSSWAGKGKGRGEGEGGQTGQARQRRFALPFARRHDALVLLLLPDVEAPPRTCTCGRRRAAATATGADGRPCTAYGRPP